VRIALLARQLLFSGTVTAPGQAGDHDFRAIHARFARYVIGIYAAAAAVAIAALLAALISDLQYQRRAARQSVELETQLRAQYLGRHLALLAEEVHRLGDRPEIDLLDQEFGPEERLLLDSHDNSTIFNRGVALLDGRGARIWAAPSDFLEDNPHPVPDPLLAAMATGDEVQILPSGTGSPQESVLYVASPVRRNHVLTGVLLGAIDLVAARAVDTGFGRRTGGDVLLVTRGGRLLFPPSAPAAERISAIVPLQAGNDTFLTEADVGIPLVVASAPVPNTAFLLLSVLQRQALDAPAWSRLTERLFIGIGLAALPLVGLSLLLRGSLRAFRVAEEEAISAERMQSLGEAASLIAHEVRNALNGLRLGLDVVLGGDGSDKSGRRADILTSLRGEMQRLSNFTTELLTFSRGVVPNMRSLELGGFIEKVAAVLGPQADDRGVRLTTAVEGAPLLVRADPTLIHVVISNLIGNAIHFAGHEAPPYVRVEAARADRTCVVRVIDNGPGVAPNVRRRLFEPFVTGRSNGVGIGLALARRIARAHGGELREVTRPGGTCFELTLPAETS
jgi:signal transduction histidine kinase